MVSRDVGFLNLSSLLHVVCSIWLVSCTNTFCPCVSRTAVWLYTTHTDHCYSMCRIWDRRTCCCRLLGINPWSLSSNYWPQVKSDWVEKMLHATLTSFIFARRIVNDTYRTDLCLLYPPFMIALGKIHGHMCLIVQYATVPEISWILSFLLWHTPHTHWLL